MKKYIVILFALLFLPLTLAQTCTDTDGGANYFERGIVTTTNNTNGTQSFTDYCHSAPLWENRLGEYTCQNGTAVQNLVDCESFGMVCYAGECMPENQTSDCIEPYDEFYITRDTLLCPGYYQIEDLDKNGILKIASSNLTLDCNNANIASPDMRGRGIFLTYADNIKIKNCNFENYSYGIDLFHGNAIEVQNNYVFGGLYSYGIYLNQVTFNTISNNYVQNNDRGIYIYGSSLNQIKDNTAHDNNIGISLVSSNNNQFQSNTISNNQNGIYVEYSSTLNTIWNNTFSQNDQSAYESSDSNSNTWNETVGNCWSDFASNPGFPTSYIIPGPGNGIDLDPCGKIKTLPPPHRVNGTRYYFNITNVTKL